MVELNKEEYERYRKGGGYKGKKKTELDFDSNTMEWVRELNILKREMDVLLKRVRKENREEVHVLLNKMKEKK